MAKNNLFGFAAFAAAASLSLGIMAAGCGHGSGSSSANENIVNNLSTVKFSYKLAAARTKLPSDITAVQYNFVDSNSNTVTVSKKYDIKSDKSEFDIIVPHVSIDSTEANAVYYKADGSIAYVGVDQIYWNTSEGRHGSVMEPSVYETGDCQFLMEASDYVISPEECLSISVSIIPEGKYKPVNVTPFASISGIDQKILAPQKDGGYKGASYGTVSGAYASLAAGTKALRAELSDVYVTDQKVVGIELIPVGTEEDSVKMLVAEETMGLESAEGYALNKQAYGVKAVYSTKASLGPVPENIFVNGAEITAESDNEELEYSVEKQIVYISSLGSENTESDVTVKAVYTPKADEKEVTAESSIKAFAAEAQTVLTAADSDSYEDEITLKGGETAELQLVGRFLFTESGSDSKVYCEIPKDFLPAKAGEPVIEEALAEAGVVLEASADSTIKYILTAPEIESEVSGTVSLESLAALPSCADTKVTVEPAEM